MNWTTLEEAAGYTGRGRRSLLSSWEKKAGDFLGRFSKKKKRQKRSVQNIVRVLLEATDNDAYLSPHLQKKYLRIVSGLHPDVVKRIPSFIREQEGRERVPMVLLAIMDEAEEPSRSLLKVMQHLDHVLSPFPDWRPLSAAKFIHQVLVEERGYAEENLTLEQERSLLTIAARLRRHSMMIERAARSVILARHDDPERIISLLLTRTVVTPDDLAALLEDDIPMALQEGAL